VDVSSERYYLALLQFLQVPWLQSCILQGIAHSISSGAEDLMRVSRLALVRSVASASPDFSMDKVLDTLTALLENSYTDERQATPLLETIAFVVEQHIELGGVLETELSSARRLWNVVRKAHFKSTNIRKLEAAVKIYGALAAHGDMRKNALSKLGDLLLHPYPTVSNFCGTPVLTAHDVCWRLC
jgi:tubulin-specific chaperone D